MEGIVAPSLVNSAYNSGARKRYATACSHLGQFQIKRSCTWCIHVTENSKVLLLNRIGNVYCTVYALDTRTVNHILVWEKDSVETLYLWPGRILLKRNLRSMVTLYSERGLAVSLYLLWPSFVSDDNYTNKPFKLEALPKLLSPMTWFSAIRRDTPIATRHGAR